MIIHLLRQPLSALRLVICIARAVPHTLGCSPSSPRDPFNLTLHCKTKKKKKNQISGSWCKAPNEAGVLSDESKRAEESCSQAICILTCMGSLWDKESTSGWQKGRCNREVTPLPCCEVRQVNLKLHSIYVGVLTCFFGGGLFFKRFLLAAVRRLIYSRSVFHSSFSPSLPYPFLKDWCGEYTGSIKLFWPEIPLLINHLQGPLISAATLQRKELTVVCAAEQGRSYY